MSPLGLKLTLNYVRILGDTQGEVSLGLVFFSGEKWPECEINHSQV